MIITAKSISGRYIVFNPDNFVVTLQEKSKDEKDEVDSMVLSVITHQNVKEMNISMEEGQRILNILESIQNEL